MGKGRHYDPHLLFISAAERNVPYILQFGHANSGVDALLLDEITEMVYASLTAASDKIPVQCHTDRHRVKTKLWARCFCPGQNTATIDFYLGLHEYTF